VFPARRGDSFLIKPFHSADYDRYVEMRGRSCGGSASEPRAKRCVRGKASDVPSKAVDGRREQSSFLVYDDVSSAAGVDGGDRNRQRTGFDQNAAQRLGPNRRKDQQLCMT
jgi:hypothetical protein